MINRVIFHIVFRYLFIGLQTSIENMKKNVVLLLMLLLTTIGAVAQETESPVGRFSIIPRIGVALTNWSNNEIRFGDEDNRILKSKYQTGFLGGVDVEYRLTEQVGVSLGAYYAQQGFRWPSFQTETKIDGKTILTGCNNQHVNLNYVQVPLVVKAYVTRQLAMLVGAQVGFLCGDGKYKADTSDMEIDKDGNATLIEKDSDEGTWPAKKVDVSIPIGVSYEYMNVILDARYNLGLTKVDKVASGMPSQSKTNAFTFTVGYRFTL